LRAGTGMDREQQRRDGDYRHRREVALRIVGRLACVDGRHHRLRGLRADQQRVAVGRGLRDVVDTDHAARADTVLDEEGLARRLGEPLREDTRNVIDTAAGGERHDDTHWF
jgi:hypothetical protein